MLLIGTPCVVLDLPWLQMQAAAVVLSGCRVWLACWLMCANNAALIGPGLSLVRGEVVLYIAAAVMFVCSILLCSAGLVSGLGASWHAYAPSSHVVPMIVQFLLYDHCLHCPQRRLLCYRALAAATALGSLSGSAATHCIVTVFVEARFQDVCVTCFSFLPCPTFHATHRPDLQQIIDSARQAPSNKARVKHSSFWSSDVRSPKLTLRSFGTVCAPDVHKSSAPSQHD